MLFVTKRKRKDNVFFCGNRSEAPTIKRPFVVTMKRGGRKYEEDAFKEDVEPRTFFDIGIFDDSITVFCGFTAASGRSGGRGGGRASSSYICLL